MSTIKLKNRTDSNYWTFLIDTEKAIEIASMAHSDRGVIYDEVYDKDEKYLGREYHIRLKLYDVNVSFYIGLGDISNDISEELDYLDKNSDIDVDKFHFFQILMSYYLEQNMSEFMKFFINFITAVGSSAEKHGQEQVKKILRDLVKE